MDKLIGAITVLFQIIFIIVTFIVGPLGLVLGLASSALGLLALAYVGFK